MRQRCLNFNSIKYNDYGGRGINICQEWLDDFMYFYNWAMANGYEKNLTIDRKDVNGNYEPSNCRWATPKQQINNTRVNHLLTYRNETHTISEWADITGIKADTICNRINDLGWDIEKTLFEDTEKEHKKIYQYDLDGNFVKIWECAAKCEQEGYDHSNIIKCCNGTMYRYKGFIWTFDFHEKVDPNNYKKKTHKFYQYSLNNEPVKVFNSPKELESAGFVPKLVYRCCKNDIKTHKGYKWSYVPLNSKITEEND